MNSYPLHEAVKTGSLEKIESLLAQDNIDPNMKNDLGNGALHLIIRHRASFISSTSHKIVNSTYPAIVQCLLNDPRIDPHLQNNDLETPFDLAIRGYYYDNYTANIGQFEADYYKALKYNINYYISSLIIAMKNHSNDHKITFSSKYYSEKSKEQSQCISNLLYYFRAVIIDYKYFIQCIKTSYPEIYAIIKKAEKESIQHYKKIADRYHFFKNKNYTQIDYIKTRDWIRFDNNVKKIVAMLGHKEMYTSSIFNRLPQEIVNLIRLFYCDNLLLSQHDFSKLAFELKPSHETYAI